MAELPRTARWVRDWIIDPSGKSGGPHPLVSENWLRLDPPAHAWRSEYGEHNLIDERGHFHTADSWEICQLYAQPRPWTPDDYVREILPWGEGSGPSEAWEQFPDRLDGQEVLHCRREVARGEFRVEYLVWLEPATGLLLRKEQLDRDPRTGELVQHSIERDFQYNVEPPANTFVLPPPDKPLVEIDTAGLLADIRAELPPAELREIQETIATSDEAWTSGDFERFCQAWHFLKNEKTGPLPGGPDWEQALRSRPAETTWVSEITSITGSDFIGVQTGANSGSPVPAAGLLWVKSQLRVEWPGGDWEGTAHYSIQRRPEGYRLVYWSYPSEEIREAIRGGG